MEISYHPINFDAIQKGDSWTAEQLEVLTGFPANTKQYELAALGLRERIMRELEGRGRPATVAFDKGSLRVLTDSEACVYTHSQYLAGRRKMLRNLGRGLQVDRSKLTPEEAAIHDRNLIINSKEVVAMKKTRRLEIAAHKRQTPGLPEPVAVDE